MLKSDYQTACINNPRSDFQYYLIMSAPTMYQHHHFQFCVLF